MNTEQVEKKLSNDERLHLDTVTDIKAGEFQRAVFLKAQELGVAAGVVPQLKISKALLRVLTETLGDEDFARRAINDKAWYVPQTLAVHEFFAVEQKASRINGVMKNPNPIVSRPLTPAKKKVDAAEIEIARHEAPELVLRPDGTYMKE